MNEPEDEDFSRRLDIDEDMRAQRRTWRAERAGWAALAMVLAAALLGLFSGGPLSSARRADPQGALSVGYDRFLRYMAPATLGIEWSPAAAEGESVAVVLGGGLFEAVEIDTIRPEPAEMRPVAGGFVMIFRSSAGGAGSVRIGFHPERVGPLTGSVALAGPRAATVAVRSFVYP